MSATLTGSCVDIPPCSWESLLGEGSFSLNGLSPLLCHLNGHLSYSNPCVDLLFSLWHSSCDVDCFMIYCNTSFTYVNLIARFVGWTWMSVAPISGVVWKASVHGWSAVWSLWCVMVGSMAITPVCGIWALWATPVLVVIIHMSWSGAASIWIMTTWAVVSMEMWLWPGKPLPVPVLKAVSGAWPGMVTFVQFGLVMLCRGSQRRNPMWTIHYNVTILITFETSNVGALSSYMSFFLTLKTLVLIIWHHVDHRWWSDGGGQLLYNIKLFNFGYCITEHLWSPLIYAGGQTVGILQTLDEISWLQTHHLWSYTI